MVAGLLNVGKPQRLTRCDPRPEMSSVSTRLERAVAHQFVYILTDAFTLLGQKVVHRCKKLRVRQPVGAGGGDRQQGAGELVFTLGAAFKTLVAVLNTPLQRLVITGLKVQAIYPLQRPPVTSIGHSLGGI